MRLRARRWADDACRGAVAAALASVLCLVGCGTVPLLWGWQSYTVLTGSMQPLVRPGDVVVASPYDGQRLEVDDLVVVAPVPGSAPDGATPPPVTHRIARIDPDGRMHTKGDANADVDSRVIRGEDVLAQGRLLVPVIGRAAMLPPSVRVLLGAATVALLVAALSGRGRGAGRGRRGGGRRRLEPPPSTAPAPWGRLARTGGVVLLAVPLLAGAPPTHSAFAGVAPAHRSYFSTSSYYANTVKGFAGADLRGYWRLGEASGTFAESTGSSPLAPLTAANPPAGASFTRGTAGAPAFDTDTAVTFAPGTNNAGVSLASPTNVSRLAIPGPLTVAAWVRTPAGSTQAATARVVIKWNGGQLNYLLAFDSTGRSIRFLNDQSSVSNRATAIRSWPTDGAWHLVVGTFDGSTNRVYVDGVVGTNAAQTGPLFTSGDAVQVGADGSNAGLNGSVDEVAVWATALSQAQIATLYEAGTKA